MELPTQKLVHTFGALADLGQEITDSNDVTEMVMTSLHLMLGAMAIRRGAILEHLADEGVLKLVAARGVAESFPEQLRIDERVVRCGEVPVDRARRHTCSQLLPAEPARCKRYLSPSRA